MIEHLFALALHCHGGEMYRVHLHRCVPKSSALAHNFRNATTHPDAKPTAAPSSRGRASASSPPCCYVDAIIQVRPDEAVPKAKVEELAKAQPHVWLVPDTTTPRQSLTFEQTSKLWRWLVSTIPQP